MPFETRSISETCFYKLTVPSFPDIYINMDQVVVINPDASRTSVTIRFVNPDVAPLILTGPRALQFLLDLDSLWAPLV